MNTIVTQALATGMPAIVTRHSGLPEQVRDGISGRVVPEGDTAALANAIVSLAESPGMWPGMGRAGRTHVLTHYNSPPLIARQIADYRALAAGRTPPAHP